MNLFWNTALAEAGAGGEGAAAGGSPIGMIIMIVLMVAVFYFLMIRPQKKKDKAVKDMLASLKAGDRICTIGGFYGTVDSVKEDTVVLKLGSLENTVVIARWAVRSIENVATENESKPEV